MKSIKLFLYTVFCTLICLACKSNENGTISSLKGTKWKLEGIVDAGTGVLKELEPIDCEDCYTLTFDTNYTATARTINNTFKLDLLHLNPYVNFEDMLVYEDYGGKSYEITSFTRGVIAAASFTVNSEQLKLYDLGGDYLLFKPF